MELYFATTNKGKFNSMKSLLSPYVKLIQLNIKLPEPRSDDLVEITDAKLTFAYQAIKKPVMAIDAGFYIHSLKGFPKAFVNFVLDTIGIEGILKLVEGKDRLCEFKECVGYYDGNVKRFFIFSVKGSLSEEPRGDLKDHLWSSLSLIFIPHSSNKTLAEMSREEFLDWVRRYNNYNEFIDFLKQV
ncbi:MAG: hypothetical protein J7K22_03110 [Nanoarchaeota archaeon]|nr:hypothetical protein [Nanoarchaeota archaeon]